MKNLKSEVPPQMFEALSHRNRQIFRISLKTDKSFIKKTDFDIRDGAISFPIRIAHKIRIVICIMIRIVVRIVNFIMSSY